MTPGASVVTKMVLDIQHVLGRIDPSLRTRLAWVVTPDEMAEVIDEIRKVGFTGEFKTPIRLLGVRLVEGNVDVY